MTYSTAVADLLARNLNHAPLPDYRPHSEMTQLGYGPTGDQGLTGSAVRNERFSRAVHVPRARVRAFECDCVAREWDLSCGQRVQRGALAKRESLTRARQQAG